MANDFEDEYTKKKNKAKKIVKSLDRYFEKKKSKADRNNKVFYFL